MPAGACRLGDHDAAVASHLGDRIADLGKARHVFEARIGEIAAGDLRAAFEQMAGERPAARRSQSSARHPNTCISGPKRQRGIGDAAGDDDLRAPVERLRRSVARRDRDWPR